MSIKGATLIELVTAIVIISIALMGTLMSINTVSMLSADPLLIQQAHAIAESYLEEISSKLFFNGSCPAPSGGRSTYLYMCNYNNLWEVPTDQKGNAVSGLGAYTVSVSVNTSVSLGPSSGGGSPALNGSAFVNRIDVSVTHSRMQTLTLSTYRTNY